MGLAPTQMGLAPTQMELMPFQMELAPSQMELAPSQMELAPSQMELVPSQMEPEQLLHEFSSFWEPGWATACSQAFSQLLGVCSVEFLGFGSIALQICETTDPIEDQEYISFATIQPFESVCYPTPQQLPLFCSKQAR